ncbi:MAG: hypothetical protein J0M02_02780 [Planctomycetes bacterium]|nr:hypothetical protein [Planctomycetota bacterium]
MVFFTARIVPSFAVAVLLAPIISASDADPVWSGGWDCIELSSGVVISGRVLGAEGPNLRIDTGFAEIVIERARVLSMRQGDGDQESVNRADPRPVASSRSITAEPAWTLDFTIAAGIHQGTLESQGSVTDHIAGITQELSFKQRLGQIDPNPSIRAALSHRVAPSSPFSVGLALEHGTASGADLRLSLWSLEMIGGWQIADNGFAGASWQAQFGCGWHCASGTQTLALSYGSGSPADNTDIDTDLQGPLLRIEVGPRWRTAAWHLGVIGGATWSSLHGSNDWSSDQGIYTGSFDYDATVVAGYVGLRTNIEW